MVCPKNKASYVLLFGSSIEKEKGATDIDLGVKGIERKLFFKFYAELVKQLSKPVDLSPKSLFNNIYNGIENILKQVPKAEDTETPKSETWHKDLPAGFIRQLLKIGVKF